MFLCNGWSLKHIHFLTRLRLPKYNLEAAEIPARIENEHTNNMDWLYSNALGGVRLLVPESYAEEAKGLLTQDFSQELEQ